MQRVPIGATSARMTHQEDAMHQPTAPRTDQDPRWKAVVDRDRKADGRFVYGVKTTGVYCRPACPSRLAKPENVAFFDSCEAAEAAGLRPCKRCHPRGLSVPSRQGALVAEACRAIETAEAPPRLDWLAARAGLSPWHFHRLFKAETGLTPRDYAAAHRSQRLRTGLIEDGTVTAAIYDAGYNTPSRFYETSRKVLGMTPTAFREGGKEGGKSADIRFAIGECSLGSILIACSKAGVCAILIGDDPELLARDLQDRFPQANLIGGDAAFEQTIAALVAFVERPGLGLELPLDIRGTAFQQRVWQALLKIPAGKTATYTDIARMIGEPKAVRAVAGACAANKIAVAIPCHRIVRNDGSLSGYRWGVERKRALLDREAV